MREKSVILGWSIKQGDYLRDSEYDETFINNKSTSKFYNID